MYSKHGNALDNENKGTQTLEMGVHRCVLYKGSTYHVPACLETWSQEDSQFLIVEIVIAFLVVCLCIMLNNHFTK